MLDLKLYFAAFNKFNVKQLPLGLVYMGARTCTLVQSAMLARLEGTDGLCGCMKPACKPMRGGWLRGSSGAFLLVHACRPMHGWERRQTAFRAVHWSHTYVHSGMYTMIVKTWTDIDLNQLAALTEYTICDSQTHKHNLLHGCTGQCVSMNEPILMCLDIPLKVIGLM